MHALRQSTVQAVSSSVAVQRATIIFDEAARIIMSGGDTGEFVRRCDETNPALRDDLHLLAREHIRNPQDGVKTAFIEPHWMVSTQTVRYHDGRAYVMSIDLASNVHALSRAAQRFSLTRRELDVLALLLDGFVASEIAQTLHIAEGTVQVYYKRLRSKTNSRNRTSMVAQVLAWQGSFASGHRLRHKA